MEWKIICITDFGITPDTNEDISEKLQEVFQSLSDNTVIHFKKGTYQIKKQIRISGKKNWKILGNRSTILAHFDPCGPISENNNVFQFSECEDMELIGFVFDTDAPIGAAGRIIAIDRENGTADLQIYEEFPVTGFEHFCATNSFDEKGSPDYALATYHNTPTEQEFTAPDGQTAKRLVGLDYTVIADQTVRLNLEEELKPELKIGHEVNIRYEIYGNTILGFASCHRFLIKDIMIYSAASMGAVISPRSSDFVFDNFCIQIPHGSKRLMAANADGIHLNGLCGKLTLKNSNMEYMGDDTLNIHGLAGGISRIEKEQKSLTLFRPFRGEKLSLPAFWAVPGDKIYVYDSKTFLYKGSFVIDTLDKDWNATYRDAEGDFGTEDTLANAAYFASLHLDGCTVRNTRARGFLVQTHDVLIENSYIYGMALPALLFAPDIRVWWEVGPCKNVELRNNVIEYCANIKNGANQGAIVFKACHDVGGQDYPAGVHENLYIHSNRFLNNPNSGIYVSAAKNVRIENNSFENCCYDVQDPSLPYAKYDIVTVNCENLTVSGNTSNRGMETLHWTT